MSIVREVPVELIVMYNECLYHPPETCAHLTHGGESEVWVVETNVFGYTKLPVSCFMYENIPSDDRRDAEKRKSEFIYRKRPKEYNSGSLFSSQMIDILPCKGNRIVELLIERDQEK